MKKSIGLTPLEMGGGFESMMLSSSDYIFLAMRLLHTR
jgi:hypothetical protein